MPDEMIRYVKQDVALVESIYRAQQRGAFVSRPRLHIHWGQIILFGALLVAIALALILLGLTAPVSSVG